jgi:hypothetical protein
MTTRRHYTLLDAWTIRNCSSRGSRIVRRGPGSRTHPLTARRFSPPIRIEDERRGHASGPKVTPIPFQVPRRSVVRNSG